jgi:salicylate hydroxylase
MRVVIVGGGIGGVTAALALRHHGIDYVVLEQAKALTDVGAGLQLSPNGVRVLDWLGLRQKLAEFCVEPLAHRFQDWRTGEVLLTLPLAPDVEAAYGYPYYHAHRRDLLGALVERLGGDRLRLEAKVLSVTQSDGGVEACLADDSIEKGDVLIGADGIHSLVRDQVIAPDRPRFAGYSAWRGLVPAETARPLGIERYACVWLGHGRSVVIYYVSAGRTVNWVSIGRSPGAERESWSAVGRREDAIAEHAGWHPQVLDLVALTEQSLITRLYDREPLERWVAGRIALLGDAAHAMLPYHAQGAVQSIEDAWVLASCLSRAGSDAPAALRRYEGLRLGRTAQVQQQSRAAQQWYHVADPAEVEKRNARFRRTQAASANGFSSGQDWLYAYDAEKAARGEDADWQRTSWSGGR